MHPKRFQRTIHKLFQELRFGRRYVSRRFARKYDRGKQYEGLHDGLRTALNSVVRLHGAVVADIGCGTGQMARRLTGVVSAYHGFDVATAMVDRARRNWRSTPATTEVTFAVADAGNIPLDDHSVDVVIYPWSLASVVTACRETNWQVRVRDLLSEAERVLRRDGAIAVIETANLLGELPWGAIWHPMRRDLLTFLENECGFERVFFSNDWDFQTPRNVRRYGGIWFERATLKEVLSAGRTILEECAGIWWRRAAMREPV